MKTQNKWILPYEEVFRFKQQVILSCNPGISKNYRWSFYGRYPISLSKIPIDAG